MKIIIFCATRMVDPGVFRECLRDLEVRLIVTVGQDPGDRNALKSTRPEIAGSHSPRSTRSFRYSR